MIVTMANRALCVGINDYPGTNMDLAGCVNDAKDWQAAPRTREATVSTPFTTARPPAPASSKHSKL